MFSLDQKHLQRLVESSPDIVIAVDRKGIIIYYNDGARQGLGFTAPEVIGQNCTLIYPSLDEAKRVMRAMRASADHSRVGGLETGLRNKQGEVIPVLISGSIITDETGEVGSIGFARDIRKMRRHEQLATAGEIAVSLAHEIYNPLESIVNNLDLLSRSLESHLTDAERVVEEERLDSIRHSVERVRSIVGRLDEMTKKGEYSTRDYLAGRRMADLAPRAADAQRAKADSTAEKASETSTGEDWPLTAMSVLVLDDDLSVVNSLSDILRAERCVVYSATRPSAALGLIRNMKVDAVLSDVVMPEMDGYDFYMKVKEEMPELPVILMTAYNYDKDHILKRARLKGLEGALFKKPVNPGKLRSVLIDLRAKAQAAKAAAYQAKHQPTA